MSLTLQQLADQHQAWADVYYRSPDGCPTKQANNVHDALRELTDTPGPDSHPGAMASLPADDFTLADLNRVQQTMVASGRLCRDTVNKRIKLIRHMFRWAANQGLVDELLPHRLSAIQPLQHGRTAARDPVRDKSVPWEMVTATLPHMPLRIATMVELQWWTAMRPGEVCAMRTSEIHPSHPDLWHYCPVRHKTAHHNILRRVSIGPIGINLIRNWLRNVKGDLLFEGGRNKPSGKPIAVMSYRNAVSRACEAAKVPHWSPAKIRHSTVTRTYEEYDIKHAMEQAGHTTERTTRTYIDQPVVQHTLADDVARHRG